MQKGNLIVNDIICQISFEENPSIYLEEKTNEDNTKYLTGFQKWRPFKINILYNFGYDLITKYDYMFVVSDKVVWKLIKCSLNTDLNEINFESCVLYQEREFHYTSFSISHNGYVH